MKVKKNPWSYVVLSRKIVQVFFLAAFLALLFVFQHRNGASLFAAAFFWIDPLISLTAMIASRSLIPLLFIAVAVIALTFAFGRVWCGWICPMGTILDFFGIGKKRKDSGVNASALPKDAQLRKIKYAVLIAVIGAALLGNLTLIALDPLTVIARFYSLTLVPSVNTVVTSALGQAYSQGIFTDGIDAIESVIRGNVLPVRAGFFEGSILAGIIFVSIMLLNLVRHRFFCRYICPLGGLLGLVSRVALARRKVTGPCSSCNNCDTACNLGIIEKDKEYASDPGECTVCFDCFPACPKDGIAYALYPKPEPRREYDPGRRTFIASVGFAALGAAFLAAEPKRLFADDYLLRPPGSLDEGKFLGLCVRCGECINVCPTSGLVGCLGEAGLEGVFTPRLTPRSGACDYACKTCGEVCPTGAIRKLTLEEKRKFVIGKAFIDRSKCIAWTDNDFCAVCSEFCPVRPKAIELVEQKQMNPRTGELVVVPLPYVIKENCVGCGTCENGCPVAGQSAIRVKRLG